MLRTSGVSPNSLRSEVPEAGPSLGYSPPSSEVLMHADPAPVLVRLT